MFGFRRDAQGAALLGSARLAELVARSGSETPAYFYDLDGVRDVARRLEAAFETQPHVVAYAVKANSAGPILRTAFGAGLGADVVSGAELELALRVGAKPRQIVMSGVGKTDRELDQAISANILAIQAESAEEVTRIAARARAAAREARVALRINPGVAIDSHAHIATGHDAAKFGVPAAEAAALLAHIDEQPTLRAVGLSTHIGSMQTSTEEYQAGARRVAELALARRANGRRLEYVNFGGGFGVDYGGRPAPAPEAFAAAALSVLREAKLEDHLLLVEPGRAVVAPFGVLVARVVQAKVTSARRWLVLDAGMNDLIRPALYTAHHRIEPLDRPPEAGEWRVVGPVCESSDDFGTHPIGETVPELVALRDAGAYGFTMASEYNGRALPSEVFVSDGKVVAVLASPGVEAWIRRRL